MKKKKKESVICKSYEFISTAQVKQHSSCFLHPVLSSSGRSKGILLAVYSSCLIHLQLQRQNRENKPCPFYSPPLAASPPGCEPGCRLLIRCCWSPGDHWSFWWAVNSFAASMGHTISIAAVLCCFLQHCPWLPFFPHYWITFFFLIFT